MSAKCHKQTFANDPRQKERPPFAAASLTFDGKATSQMINPLRVKPSACV